MGRVSLPRHPARFSSGFAAAISSSTPPNVTTMVAPVGRSHCSDSQIPTPGTPEYLQAFGYKKMY